MGSLLQLAHKQIAVQSNLAQERSVRDTKIVTRDRTTYSADGERRAVTGLYAQYRLCARRIHSALQRGNFEWVELMSRHAEAMDDIVLATAGRLDALQLKHSTTPKGITLAALLRQPAEGKFSLIRQMADGWRALKKAHPDRLLSARLVFRGIPSGLGQLDDHIALPKEGDFHRFLLEGWNTSSKPEDHEKWRSLREAILLEALVTRDEAAGFFSECGIDFVNALDPMDTRWADSDVDALANHLLKIAAADVRPGKIDQDTLLQGLGWVSRFQIKFSHEWKIDERYQSIHATTEPLINLLAQTNGGYAALLGTPGSGKSTTLSHTLRKTGNWRFVPYYAYLPGDISQGRGEAVQFLHDLVLSLRRHGFRGGRGYASENLDALRNELTDLFGELGKDFQKTGRRTVILVDGLDHIPREQTPTVSLLSMLPHPDSIPPGVLFFLGSQTLTLPGLSPAIQISLETENRIVKMSPMSRGEIRTFVERSQLTVPLDDDQFRRVERLSEGHPLSLALLVERLRSAKEGAEVHSILDNAPTYGGHIEKSYQIFWESIRRDSSSRRMLARWARLQGFFSLSELLEVFEASDIEKTLDVARPYLRVTGAGTVDFFHNSFRQFVLSKTRKSNLGIDENVAIHRELCTLFAALPTSSPLGWEAAYHARMAGAHAEALALMSPERQRAQYLEGRPTRGIFQDIHAAVEITGRKDERAEAIGLLLNWQEFYQRARSTEQQDHVVLIYRLYGAQAVRRHIESKGLLVVGAKAAWQLCQALWDSGERTHAREIYEISEPIGALTGQIAVDMGPRGKADGDLGEWAKLALNFRPLEEVITGIGRLRAGSRRFGGDSSPELENARLRSHVLQQLAEVFVDREDWSTVERLQAEVPKQMLQEWQLNLDWHLVHRHSKHARATEALSRLEVTYADEPHMAFELAEIAWRITGDRDRVMTWVERAVQPESPVKDEIMNAGPKVRNRIILTRILATIGEPVDVENIVPELSENRHYGRWLFDRAITKLAILWGEGRAGKNYEANELQLALRPLLRLYHHRYEETRNWGSWQDSESRRKEYFEWVIKAAAAHGAEAVAVLGAEFDQIWENEQEAIYWSASLRRDVAKRLYRHDGNLEAFRRRLDHSARASGKRSFDLDEIGYELTDLAETWLLANAADNARATYRKLLELSFALPEKGGGSTLEWTTWWERSLDGGREKLVAGALHLGGLLERLHRLRRGEELDEAGVAFLQILAQRDSGLTHQYAVRFLDAGFQTFEVAISADLLSISKTVPADADFAVVLASALLVPFATGSHNEIAQAIADLPTRDSDADGLRRELMEAVERRALPRLRNTWMERLQGLTTTAQKNPGDDSGETKTGDEYQTTENEARERWKNLNSAEGFLAIFRERSTAQESIFLDHGRYGYVLGRIPKKDWPSLIEAGLSENWSPVALSCFARELRAQGLHTEAARIASRAFAISGAKGWSQIFDGGTRLRPAKEWVASSGESARAAVFRQWIEDYAAGNAYAPATPADLRDLCELFLERPPWSQLWKQVTEQQLALAEVQSEPLPVIEPSAAITPQGIAEYWIMWCAVLPVPELHDAAFKALRSLARFQRHHSWVHGICERYLEINDETRCEALMLLGENKELAAKAPTPLVKRCRELARHPSGLVRAYARTAIDHLPDAGLIDGAPAEGELPLIYKLTLPAIGMKTFSLPAESYPKGAPPMETEDRYEWTVLYKGELEVLSKHSGIPFQNLVRRLTDLMLAEDRATWSADAEKKLIDRLDNAGLKLPYRRLRGHAASRALARILTELYDASQIDFDLFQALGVRLNPIDKVISSARPVAMPPEIVVPETRYLNRYDSIPWSTLPQDPLEVCVRRIRDGRIVVAELSRFRYWNPSSPTEIRASALIPSAAKKPPSWNDDFGFVLSDYMWRADMYPSLPGTSAIHSPAVGGHDVEAMVGSEDWVAFNPALARALKWYRRAGTMFGWEDRNGVPQVDTIWWSQGPYQRVDTHQGALSAQGWLVVATQDAVKSFRALTPLSRYAAIQRTTSGADREPPSFLSAQEELADPQS